MTADALRSLLVPGTDPDIVDAYSKLSTRAGEESFGFEEEIAFVDIETTGFDPSSDEIIELGAVVAKGPTVIERFSTLVAPGVPVPKEITHLTGIDDEMLKGQPGIQEAMEALAGFVGTRDLVAHNSDFDQRFIGACCKRAGLRLEGGWADSLELARIALPLARSHRLSDLARAFDLGEANHRALADAEATFRLWRVCLCALQELPAEVLTSIATLAPSVRWGLRATLAHVAAGRPSGGADLRELRRARVKQGKVAELADAREVELAPPDRAAIVCEFDAEGAVGRMYPDYEKRREQLEMTEAVSEAFAEGRHAVIEAGTGVGKSVAYLVPAIRFAADNRIAVGVTTKTNTLMDQLIYSELPRLAEELACDFSYVALKGYSHYVCLRKLERHLLAASNREEVANGAALLAWVSQSSWGDTDSLNLHWSAGLRSQVVATPQECTKKRCRFFPGLCLLHGQRRRALAANVVVTNHALLFSDVVAEGGILPPIRHWIVDEAHAAEAVARDQMSWVVDHGGLLNTLRSLAAKRAGPAQMLAEALEPKARGDDADEALERAMSMREAADTAYTVSGSLFGYVKELGEGSQAYDREELRITARMRDSAAWSHVARVGRSLARHLSSVLEHGMNLLAIAEEHEKTAADERAELSGMLAHLSHQLAALVAVIEGEDDGLVYSVTIDRRAESFTDRLEARKIDVGDVLADTFYPRMRSVVFTSATMAAGNDFSHFERSVGLDRLEESQVLALRLPSSYDFERQMAAFAVSDAPEPDSPGYHSRLTELLIDLHSAMGGSVLTLFTNRRDLEALYASCIEPLEDRGLRLVAQTRGQSTKRIRDEFVGDKHSSLFATRSFWEGFDAKGDTLRCVVVVRLPFAHLGDPLLEELRERDPGGWWSKHYLPRAVLELKQAAGRLIRSATDEGCLVIVDSRVAGGRSYGSKFLDALPVRSVRVVTAGEALVEIGERFGR